MPHSPNISPNPTKPQNGTTLYCCCDPPPCTSTAAEEYVNTGWYLSILLALGPGEVDEVEPGNSRAGQALLLHDFRGLDDQREHGVGARRLAVHGGLSDVPVAEAPVKDLARGVDAVHLRGYRLFILRGRGGAGRGGVDGGGREREEETVRVRMAYGGLDTGWMGSRGGISGR